MRGLRGARRLLAAAAVRGTGTRGYLIGGEERKRGEEGNEEEEEEEKEEEEK